MKKITWPKLMTVACQGGNNSINENQFWLTNLKKLWKGSFGSNRTKIEGGACAEKRTQLVSQFFFKKCSKGHFKFFSKDLAAAQKIVQIFHKIVSGLYSVFGELQNSNWST